MKDSESRKNLPFMKFFPKDWLADTAILTDEEKAIWIDLLCHLWMAKERGQMEVHINDLTLVLHRDRLSLKTSLDAMSRKGVLEYHFNDDQTCFVQSRRMTRDHKRMIMNNYYQKKHRNKSKTNVRQMSGQIKRKMSDVRCQIYKPYSPLNKNEDFDQFWKAYPKKVGKVVAMKSWIKINPNEDLRNKIMAALANQRKQEQWQRDNGQYIPHPASWLNQGRWEDEINVDKRKPSRIDKLLGRTREPVRSGNAVDRLPDL